MQHDVSKTGRGGSDIISHTYRSEVIATSIDDFHFLAPHEEETQEIVIKDHPVVDKVRKGDVLQFMRNVGGGGGHSLTVDDFNVKLELIKF